MNIQQFIGKSIEEGRQIATNAGFEIRVQNMGVQTLNNEFRQGRINFKIINDVIVSVTIG